MRPSVWQEIYTASHHAFRIIVPLPHHRTPWAWNNAYWAIVPFIPLGVMAYLVRRRDTFVMRLLLLPATICLLVHSAHGFYWSDPLVETRNWSQRFVCAQFISKALECALTPSGLSKVGETRLPPIGGEKDVYVRSSPTAKHGVPNLIFFPPAVSDAFEVLFACRGYGWDFEQGVHKPQEYRPLERHAFVNATWIMVFRNFIVIDFLDAAVKLVPEASSPSGGSIFLPLPPVQRCVVSAIIVIMTAIGIRAGFEVVYGVATLIGVGLLNQSPLLWPPPFDHPFSSDSLTVFWGKGWHQSLRRMFFIYGGYPAFWLGSWISKETGKALMVFGVFTASGLFHELSTYTPGRGLDMRTTRFFVGQAVAVLGERAWFKLTGTKVHGWIGFIWVCFWTAVLGQQCIDAWYRRGLGSSAAIPTYMSPTRNLLWPILRWAHPVFKSLP
ncbi:hypothetical protein BJ322DRAFT_1213017 [Thelephora terrestris]|uniref:Wax synthase domain-containing protein n=1 Tax=Thelephora terrestris TaxID=56493 RepID=A0A9P6HBD3_9AGAM|nr:hypothetical protein BJ322DRAFT_1213017 [Thelephora terrestris]